MAARTAAGLLGRSLASAVRRGTTGTQQQQWLIAGFASISAVPSAFTITAPGTTRGGGSVAEVFFSQPRRHISSSVSSSGEGGSSDRDTGGMKPGSWSMPFPNEGPGGKQRGSGGAFIMRCDGGTLQAWNDLSRKPKLGTWPNVEAGVERPDVTKLPEPTIFMKEDRRPIIGGVSDATMIEQYDQVKGTADLGDNAGAIAGMTAP